MRNSSPSKLEPGKPNKFGDRDASEAFALTIGNSGLETLDKLVLQALAKKHGMLRYPAKVEVERLLVVAEEIPIPCTSR